MMKKKRFLYLITTLLIGISFYLTLPNKITASKIPILFISNSYHPIIKVQIQGLPLSFEVDLGGSEYMSLLKKPLDSIQKHKLMKTDTIWDFRGNRYDRPIYSVSDVKVGPIELSNCEITEEDLDFHHNTGLWPTIKGTEFPEYHGRIGIEFFKDKCVLFDFPDSSIFIARTLNELQEDSLLNLDHYIGVPFTVKNGVVLLTIETDLKKHAVVLDTGSTFCNLSKALVDPEKIVQLPNGKCYFPSNKLMIEGCNFGDWKFAVLDICDKLGFDGALGVDFFLEHAICIDFPNQVAYIKKPGNVFGAQWQRGKVYLKQFFIRNFSDFPKMEGL